MRILEAIFITIAVVALILVLFAIIFFLVAVPIIGWTVLFIIIVIVIFVSVLNMDDNNMYNNNNNNNDDDDNDEGSIYKCSKCKDDVYKGQECVCYDYESESEEHNDKNLRETREEEKVTVIFPLIKSGFWDRREGMWPLAVIAIIVLFVFIGNL